jgi:hypothetical protein
MRACTFAKRCPRAGHGQRHHALRINLGVFLLWVVVLAVTILRVQAAREIVRGVANFSTPAQQRH